VSCCFKKESLFAVLPVLELPADQADLKLTEVLLPLPPRPPHLASLFFSLGCFFSFLKIYWGWGFSSVVEHLPSKLKALGSVPSSGKKRKKKPTKQRFIYLFIIYKYTVAVFRHSRRGHQISFQMVVSHHVVSGI